MKIAIICVWCFHTALPHSATAQLEWYIHPLLDTVQGINCRNFDNFRATQCFVRWHNPAYILHVAPPLLYSDPSVLSLLPNDVVGPCVTTTLHKYEYFTHSSHNCLLVQLVHTLCQSPCCYSCSSLLNGYTIMVSPSIVGFEDIMPLPLRSN